VTLSKRIHPADADVTTGHGLLAYLSRYTPRVAIANNRLIALDEQCITFK